MSNTSRKWPKVLLGILVVVVILGAVGLQLLDSFLLKQAQAQAATVSKQLGRPVRIEGIATKVLTGLGVRVTGISVGPGAGEKEPLAGIDRIEVKVALLKAAFSRGKEVEIRSAEIEGLRVNVVKYPDGKTNLEHLQEALAEEAAKNPKKPEEEKKGPADLSAIQIDHFALSEGRIAFIDRSGARSGAPGGEQGADHGGGAAQELAISHLALRVDGVRAGAPLEILLEAAVLAEQKNFELKLKTEPLPNTLTPVPESLSLKVQPIDLAPLGPFVPQSVGLLAGKLDADFQAQLGAAVPGGDGPTNLKGAVHALGLRFAGAKEGKPLDVVLEADVKGDAAKGDLQIDRLRLDLGPAGLTGKGRVSGLASGAGKVEGLEVISHDLDPARLAAYYPPLNKMLDGQVSGPIGISLHGAGTQGAQSVELKLDLTAVRLAVPAVMAKAPGGQLLFTLSASGAAASGGTLKFNLKAQLDGVDLRPGESLNKGPGDKLEFAMVGQRSVSGSKAAPVQRIEVADLELRLLDESITGTASATLTSGTKKKTQFELALKSDRIDLEKLLLPGPAKKKEKPPPDRKAFAGLSGRAELRIATVKQGKAELKNVVVIAEVNEDEVDLKSADLELLSGKISAAGSKLKLAHPKEPFHALLKIDGVDLAGGVAMFTDKKVIAGKFTGGIDLTGGGQEKVELEKTLTGNMDGHLLDGVFYGRDLIASVTGPLARSLPFGLAGKEGQGGQTSLGKDLPIGIAFANGEARLKQPLHVAAPQGELSFTGGIKLDGTLDLPGTVLLSPQTISEVTGGRAKVSAPVPVKLRVTGPAWSPQVVDLDLKDAATMIVKQAASGVLGKLLGQEGKSVDQIGDAKKKEAEELGQKKAAEAQGQAQAEAQKAQQKGQEEADRQRKKLEEEARNKLKGLFGR